MLHFKIDRFQTILLCSVVALLATICAQAQIDRATLTGIVTDPSGAVIPNAEVKATEQSTGVESETKTNARGLYRLPGLAVGSYTIKVERRGFATAQYNAVTVTVGETRTVNVRMQVGAVNQTVEVQANAPLEQTSPEMSGVINTEQIQSLPVNGRNWASLLLLAPGAIDDGGGDQRTIRFAGRARDDNNYTMDGVDATGIQEQAQKSTTRLQVSEDAVEEYRVSSALYTAEHGAGAGGQVDLVTKGGTNQFHGTAFDYFRNSVLDSRAFNDFDAFTNQPIIPPFRLNQFGGTFGGPIVKDKTFFFLSYEGLRQFQGRTVVGFVPSVPLRNAITTTSPTMAPIVSAFPLPNVITSVCNDPTADPCTDEFVHQGSTTLNEDSFLVRLDHKITDRTTLYSRISRDISFTSAPLGNLLDLQQIDTKPANYLVALLHSFSSRVFNEVKFGINRAPYHNPQASVFPFEIDTDNFEALNNSATDNEVGTTFGYIDNLSIAHGGHTFKTGIEVRRVRLNQGITEDDRYIFSDNLSLINNSVGNVELRGSWLGHGLRHTLVLPYFQDEWKAKPNLTLNLGLRWEYYSVISEAHGRMSIFDLDGCHGFCPSGSAPYFPNYRNFDPRIGIAWAPKALHDKTVIRTGFGIYHGMGQNDDLNASLESDANQKISIGSMTVPDRFSISSVDVANLAFPVNLSTLPASALSLGPRAILRHRRDLYVEQWGFSIQHELPRDFIFQSSYTGTHGVRLFARSNENLCLAPPNPNTEACPRPLPAFGEVDLKRNDGTSTFNALNLSLQRQFTHGWLWQTQYMWSHSINDGSVGGGEANAPENVNCRHCDRGPSIYDIRHNFVSASVYDLPFGPGRRYLNHSGFLGRLLEGWSLTGTGLWHTGHPLTPLVGLDPSQIPNGESISDQRPDLVPGVSVIPPGGQTADNWININAFAMPPVDANGVITHFGDAPRGIIRAPHVWQVDTGLTKNTKLSERTTLEFRAEAFNVFNHVQLGDPSQLDILAGPGAFGVINTTVSFNNNNDNFGPGNTGTGLPRQIEFMLRLKF
jgi:hypothetical protein